MLDPARREKRREDLADNYLENRDIRRVQIRRRYLIRTYGITPERYDELLAEQGGVCAICRRPERAQRRGVTWELSIDHDHSCCPGKRSCGACVGGLLCQACNHALSDIEDDPDRIAAMAEYLDRYRTRRLGVA